MFYRLLFTSLIALLAVGAQASINLQDVRFSELPGGRVEMRIDFSAVPAIPQGYAIEKPARIVLDFPGVQSVLSKKKYSLGLGNTKSAVILTAKDRTRVILNLSNAASYEARVEGNSLVAVIENSIAADSTYTRDQKVTIPDSVVKSNENAITDVDFRRDENGAGKIILSLSNPRVAVDIEKKFDNISMLFSGVTISEALQRRLDVVDFATPVKFIETRAEGNNVSIKIDVDRQSDYLAYQADNAYVVSISPLTEAQIEEQRERFKYVGEKLSLNFQDIEVRKVLEIIADFTELNLVASDTVKGNITLRLENVPWDQALELVLKSKGLDKRQAGNVLLVAPAAEIAERERQELESRKQLQELEPLETEFIRIRYAKASDVYNLFASSASGGGAASAASDAIANVLSSRGTAVVDERTNSIILTDAQSRIEAIKNLIGQVDVPVRQVMIEARIVSASDNFRKELGFQITGTDTAVAGNGNDNLGGNLGIATPTQSVPLGTFGITYLPSDVSLTLELTALENAGYGEVISQPKVLTGDKQTAKIESGQQIPFTSSDGDTVTTIFQDAVLSLEVTPQITPDNRIIMELKVNRDSLDADTVTPSGSPINVTELTTTALVGDGDTIVLGGIFEQTNSKSESKVPLLGDIPVLGRLFRRDIDINEKSELLIFITPRILSDAILDQ